ncbi:MAG: 3'(2'),5'-bisphosphate nucleotidase [Flavobacterium sp. MedPE-SWcel]|uniref:3'(2'),5'-bisphosphate nucleotidase CysQ n=1 Tax=uncultured Flavobacterium sp. TaxID=165435 RepID=UPI0009134A85|nr:3'(2'),5'-bisphosphate nucleotidase CysQ [uncultured Flavobacterium sp.]OIQ21427.1 MAG: 3'(2'),5'-bisphosphate nucleotidase [Flavobacterium sp. MedPE-SWcel]
MKQIYNTAIQASIEAGEAIMKIYEKDFEVAYKEDASPLTEADSAANVVIMRYLSTTEIPVISEENKQLPYSDRKDWSSCWIVDPLDGTKEFIKKNGEFTVNIALVINGIPEFGVIYVPAVKTLYYGDVTNSKSYRVVLDNVNDSVENIIQRAEEIKPIQDDNTLRVVGSRSHMSQDTQDFVDSLKETTSKEIEIVSKGSSLKFCLVAEGKADVYPRFAPTMEWDTAAGQAICKSVGLSVTDNVTKQEMMYNKENLLNPYFLVSS